MTRIRNPTDRRPKSAAARGFGRPDPGSPQHRGDGNRVFKVRLSASPECASMSLFGEPMRWMTSVAAAILLADVHNRRRRVFRLDLEGGDESIFCVHGNVVRLSIKFKPDCKVHWRASLFIFSPGFETNSSPRKITTLARTSILTTEFPAHVGKTSERDDSHNVSTNEMGVFVRCFSDGVRWVDHRTALQGPSPTCLARVLGRLRRVRGERRRCHRSGGLGVKSARPSGDASATDIRARRVRFAYDQTGSTRDRTR